MLDTLLCTTPESAFHPLEVSDEPCHLSKDSPIPEHAWLHLP